MERQLAFIQKRNKIFNIALAILFTVGLGIEILTRKQIDALVMFSVSIAIFYSLYFFVVRHSKLINPTMYFIAGFILLFICKSVTSDTNIVFYMATLMFFSFIAFYENFRLSIICAAIMTVVSGSALLKESDKIFTDSILATPDLPVFLIINTFVYVFLIMQNRASEKNRHALYESEKAISFLAYNDALTGLPNRRAFAGEVGSKLEKAEKTDSLMAVIFIDMDKFKSINDTYGHDAGDALLISVAARLNATVGDKGISARLGGDEFTILMHNNVTEESIISLVKEVLQSLQPPYTTNVGGKEIGLDSTPSIGVSIYPKDATTVTGLITLADEAMYIAKQSGKNNFKFANVK